MEAAIASPDPDAYFDVRSRWRRVEETVLCVLGDTGALELVHDEAPYPRALGARDEHVPGEMLQQLASDEALIVRVAVASNPHTPVAGLAVLCREGSWHVRVELAENRSSPSWLVAFLAGDRLPRVRAAVAGLPRPPGVIVTKLVTDPDWHVRAALAANKALSQVTLGALADDFALRVASVGRKTLHRSIRP